MKMTILFSELKKAHLRIGEGRPQPVADYTFIGIPNVNPVYLIRTMAMCPTGYMAARIPKVSPTPDLRTSSL